MDIYRYIVIFLQKINTSNFGLYLSTLIISAPNEVIWKQILYSRVFIKNVTIMVFRHEVMNAMAEVEESELAVSICHQCSTLFHFSRILQCATMLANNVHWPNTNESMWTVITVTNVSERCSIQINTWIISSCKSKII